MNELIQGFEPKDADSRKIVAAVLASAACSLGMKGMDMKDAVDAVTKIYKYFLTSNGAAFEVEPCLAVWERFRNN